MTANDRWQLPDGVDELLPAQAERLEALRRLSLDLLRGWGYRLIEPPLIEYLESLLSGMGEDLDLQTFKLIDQETGRMLGVRADITLQAARVDNHRLKHDGPTRLCYCGPVLHTAPERLASVRNPMQLGAELYGSADITADIEIIRVMLGVLAAAGIHDVWLDLGHVGVFRAIVGAENPAPAVVAELFRALQRKDSATIASLDGVPAPLRDALIALTELNGGPEVLQAARSTVAVGNASIDAALQELDDVIAVLQASDAGCSIHVDLAETRGYRYHTGVTFAAYTPTEGDLIAKGGRYDNVGAVFGRARPATGFSVDLKQLATMNRMARAAPSGIVAPAVADAALEREVARARSQGERVVQALPDSVVDVRELDCDREFVRDGGEWVVRKLGG